MSRKIRDWLRGWLLGDVMQQLNKLEVRTDTRFAELTSLSADVCVHGESTVVIISRIGGGCVKIINAKFGGVRELRDFMRFCEARFGAKSGVIDAPYGDARMRF